MIDALLPIGISNFLLSAVLALVAWIATRAGKHPHLAHFLWLLVIAKLLTPPLYHLPLLERPGATVPDAPASLELTQAELLALASELRANSPSNFEVPYTPKHSQPVPQALPRQVSIPQVLLLTWLAGSLFVLGASLLRILRFQSLLKMASQPACAQIQALAAQVARQLGLARTPAVCVSSANLSPLVWCFGTRARVVLPAALLSDLGPKGLSWVLAHELGHIRRRDHWVRWMEWLACVAFWWNPITWIARRQLRITEEICCDALVLHQFQSNSKSYAGTLLSVAEFLATPALRPPAVASAIHHGGSLQRRLEMIISGTLPKKMQRPWRAGTLVAAACLLGIGVTFADELPAHRGQVESSTESAQGAMIKSLQDLIHTGELSEQQAQLVYEIIQPADAPILRKLEGLYAAGVRKIDAVVEAGKLRKEDAEAKKRALAAQLQSMAFYIEVMGMSMDEAKLRLAADSGRLSPNEVAAKKAALAAMGPGPSYEWMQEHLSKGGIARDKIEPVLHLIELTVNEMKEEGESFELAQTTVDALVSLNMTGEQMDLIKGLASKAASMVPRSETDEAFEWVSNSLSEAGVARDLLPQVLIGVKKLVAEMRREDPKFEMDPKLGEYFVSLGMTSEQIELAVKCAARVAHPQTMAGGERNRESGEHAGRKSMDWVIEALSKGGLPRSQMHEVLGSIKKIVGERRREGAAFEVDPAIQKHLGALGLNSEQIALVHSLAERVHAMGLAEEQAKTEAKDRARGEHGSVAASNNRDKLYQSFELQLQAAVDAGELTAAEADKKLKALSESLFGEKPATSQSR